MEALHYGEGDDHPYQSPISSVYTDIREVPKQSPSEVVYISTTTPLEY